MSFCFASNTRTGHWTSLLTLMSFDSFILLCHSGRRIRKLSGQLWINCKNTWKTWEGNLLSQFDKFISTESIVGRERSNIANWCPSMMKSFQTSKLSARFIVEDIYIQSYPHEPIFTRPFYAARCCPPSQPKNIKLFAPNYSADIPSNNGWAGEKIGSMTTWQAINILM